MVREVLSTGSLLNPGTLNSLLTVATESLVVDDAMSLTDLTDLALRFREFESGGVVFTTVPVMDLAADRSGESVVLLDRRAMEVLAERLRRDEPPADLEEPGEQAAPPAGALAPEPPAEAVRTAADDVCAA